MTRDDIIRMAHKAGFNWPEIHTTTVEERLERFFTLAYEAGAAATYALPAQTQPPALSNISLRDYFAAQALPWVTSQLYDTKEISVAKHCYALADAMLAVSRGEE
jgi:hypothetical protein